MTSSDSLRWLAPMACVLLLTGCLLSNSFDASYDTLTAARQARAVESGWIPDWAPQSAVALREAHNVDNNASMLAFALPGDVTVPLPDGCLPATYAETLPGPFKRDWWPQPEVLAAQYSFFTCPSLHTGFEFVGMRHDGRHMLHWRTYASH